MRSDVLMRRVLLTATLVVVFATGLTIGQNKYGQPKSVIHLVTLKWKATSTPAQQQAAIAGIISQRFQELAKAERIEAMCADYWFSELRHEDRSGLLLHLAQNF